MRTRLISFVSVLCLTVSVYASDMNLSDASILFEKKSISEIDVPHVDIASTDVYYRSMHLTTGSMDMLHSSLCGSRVGRINADGLSVCLSVLHRLGHRYQ